MLLMDGLVRRARHRGYSSRASHADGGDTDAHDRASVGAVQAYAPLAHNPTWMVTVVAFLCEYRLVAPVRDGVQSANYVRILFTLVATAVVRVV